ncbi:MAG: hypothetical protein LBC76_05925 [Treponema sp.]|jgi:hypothetical protein|nr:hypothetical protein [Treponema sp.]
MNLGTLIYLVFIVTVAVFASILTGRYLYNRKHPDFINKLEFKNIPSRKVAKILITQAYFGIIIREDILKNSASAFDDDAYLRSFISFLTPDNVRAIKSVCAEMLDA